MAAKGCFSVFLIERVTPIRVGTLVEMKMVDKNVPIICCKINKNDASQEKYKGICIEIFLNSGSDCPFSITTYHDSVQAIDNKLTNRYVLKVIYGYCVTQG